MHDVPVIHHGEAESQTFAVVADDLVARQRHPIVPFAPPNGTMQKIRRLVTLAARLDRKASRGPLIDERSPSRLLQRRSQRFVLLAIRAANGCNPAEMIERLLA